MSEEEIVRAVLSFDGDKAKLIFEGAPVTDEWVKKIGGDGYAENAIGPVNVAKKLLKIAA